MSDELGAELGRTDAELDLVIRLTADLKVGEAFDLERGRLAFDMTASRRAAALDALAGRIVDLLAGDTTAGAIVDLLASTKANTQPAFERTCRRRLGRHDVRGAVVDALRETAVVLDLDHPQILADAIAGATPVYETGGRRARRNR